MSTDELAQCVLNKGFSIGGTSVAVDAVKAEITYIQTYDDCRLGDADRREFLGHVGKCLENSDPINHYTLCLWLAYLIPPKNYRPFLNPPP